MPARQAVLAVLVLASACAEHDLPTPNKNTNWLGRCATDSDCGEVLACICGLCTVQCEGSHECEGRDSDATAGVCLAAWSEQHADQCSAEPGASNICVASCADDLDCTTSGPGGDAPLDADATGPLDDPAAASSSSCITAFGVCATVVASGQELMTAIAVDDERVYWLRRRSGTGESVTVELVSVPQDGGAIRVHASGFGYPTGLKLDATHAYWIHIDSGSYSTISRVALTEGAEVEQVFHSPLYSIWAIGLAGDSVYFRGSRNVELGEAPEALFRAPKDGSLITDPQFEPEQAIIRDHLNGSSEAQIHRVLRDHLLSLGLAPDVHTSVGWNVALHSDELFWLWNRDSEGMDMVVLVPGAVGVERASADAEEQSMLVQFERAGNASNIAVDETHVYWTYEDARGAIVERTDRRTGVSETVVQAAAWNLQLALSDDQIFLAMGTADSQSWSSGLVVRFPKNASTTQESPLPGPI
jgi:hypothetical protein